MPLDRLRAAGAGEDAGGNSARTSTRPMVTLITGCCGIELANVLGRVDGMAGESMVVIGMKGSERCCAATAIVLVCDITRCEVSITVFRVSFTTSACGCSGKETCGCGETRSGAISDSAAKVRAEGAGTGVAGNT